MCPDTIASAKRARPSVLEKGTRGSGNVLLKTLFAGSGVTLAGLSGFYMTWKLDAWYRFAEADYWWMQAMVAVWAIFTVVLFIAEPLFLHDWFRTRAARDPEGTFAFVQRAHAVLLTASLVTIAGAMAGAHGWFVF